MATTTEEPTLQARTRVVIESLPVGAPEVVRVHRAAATRPMPHACGGSAAPSVHGGRLTRRGRIVLAAAWAVLFVVGLLGVMRPWGGSEPAAGSTTVRIDPGDTLWDVAGDVAPASDRREMVAAIVELNDLTSAGDIRPGDTVLVPNNR